MKWNGGLFYKLRLAKILYLLTSRGAKKKITWLKENFFWRFSDIMYQTLNYVSFSMIKLWVFD